MSFLDRLKREADQQRQQAEQLALEREQREARYKAEIEPRMKAMTSYLEGLAATLLEVKPPIVVRMAIQGYGDLCTVPFWDYKVEHERRHRGFSIIMTWSQRVDAERTPVVRADGVIRVKALTSIFRQYHLGGIKEERRTPQGEISCATFHARGYIKARMEASITADDPILRLVFNNASWLGSSRRQVPWELIDDDLFDRVGRFVVREDDTLFTEELSDALKQKLRKEPDAPAGEPRPAPATSAAPPAVAAQPQAAQAPLQQPATPPPAASAAPPPAGSVEIYAPNMIYAPAPLTQGEVIEIDESKLGLADFTEPDDAVNVFSPAATSRAAPAPRLTPTPPPVASVEVIAIDESKLGLTAEPAAVVVEHRPAAPPPPAAPAPPAPAPPRAVAAAPKPTAPAAPPPPTQAQAAVRAAAAPIASQPPASATTAAAPVTAAKSAAAAPPAGAGTPAASDGLDEAKEREAALFRLRMRAMLSRLRSDEGGEG